jgi:hypothetical protein
MGNVDMKTLTVDELLEKLDSIFEQYEDGSDECFKIQFTGEDGIEKTVILTPFDGPYQQEVKQLPDGDLFVEIPPRLLAKQGWDENTKLDMNIKEDGSITLTEINEEKS